MTAELDLTASTMLRLSTAGSVDDGKSTLIGRLLLDTKSILADQLAHVEEVSQRRGDAYTDLALLTDGLRAEREQGITIDVAYRYFATARRKFIIADTPGHVQYTRNMVTGASTADLAIVLIDARKGVLEQTRRHAFIASLLRVPHLVVAVNKMDLVGYDQAVFDTISADFAEFAGKLEITDVTFLPMSALAGDNVVTRSSNMPWFEGTSLLYHLENLHIASDRNLIDARFPVQWVIRGDGRSEERGYAGQMASGVLRPGDDVVVLPAGTATRIAAIETFDGPLKEAVSPMSVTMRLADHVDVSRGDMICRPHNQPALVREVDAIVCWMSEQPLKAGTRYALKHTTTTVRAHVAEIVHGIDVTTLHRDEGATELRLNEVGRVVLRTSRPLAVDAYRRSRATGSFVLIDEATNDTVGGGMVIDASTDVLSEAEPTQRSTNVVWSPPAVTRGQRAKALGHYGVTLWLTGLPASGKSTIAAGIEHRLVTDGRVAYRLDGDNLRHGLNGDLGFAPEERAENVRRTAHVAALMADAGSIAIVSLVSPYASDRAAARAIHQDMGLPFLELYVNTPLEECERRDPKGLYAKARAGELSNFTGVDDFYEAPAAPEVELRAAEHGAEAMVDRVLAALRELRLLDVRST
ncbi:MAG: adenylyl-sulfate kinase [Solirubrobacteraceae bacterium MAG38_C4-C5]|nr:adenylyl-sulfate kinase [Candidatus Siliceabacter maunaloa]